MKIIIIGAGFTGSQLAKKLIDEKNDVILIDNDEEIVRHAANNLDCTVIHADGNNLATLEDAGVAAADAIILLTDSDEYNMITCSLIDSVYPAPIKIARVREYGYYINSRETSINHASAFTGEHRPLYGIDFMIQPDIEAADKVISAVKHGAVADVLSFDSSYVLSSLTIAEGSDFAGIALKNIRTIIDCPFVIAYLEKDGRTILPSGETILNAGDRIGIFSAETDVPKLLDVVDAEVNRLRKIVIFGADRIGLIVAEYLLSRPRTSLFKRIFGNSQQTLAHNLVIVDDDPERCREASEKFPEIKVLCGDMTDDALIAEEGLDQCDLVVALTSNYERNVVVAAYMKSLGALRTIALAVNGPFANVARKLGVDVAIPMRDAVIDSIMSHLRGDNVRAIHTIGNGGFEIVECDVEAGSEFAGKTLREIASAGSFLVLLARPDGVGDYQLATGSTILSVGSHIVLIAPAGDDKTLARFGG